MAIKELKGIDKVQALLGEDSEYLLGHKCATISKKSLYLPSPDYVDEVFVQNDRSPAVIRNLQTILNHGRLGGRDTYPSCRSTKGLSIRLEPLLR